MFVVLCGHFVFIYGFFLIYLNICTHKCIYVCVLANIFILIIVNISCSLFNSLHLLADLIKLTVFHTNLFYFFSFHFYL